MDHFVHGTIHGKVIELDQDLGLADGSPVEVFVKIAPCGGKWGDGIRRSAGAMAPFWTQEDDQILEEIYQDRKRASGRDLPE